MKENDPSDEILGGAVLCVIGLLIVIVIFVVKAINGESFEGKNAIIIPTGILLLFVSGRQFWVYSKMSKGQLDREKTDDTKKRSINVGSPVQAFIILGFVLALAIISYIVYSVIYPGDYRSAPRFLTFLIPVIIMFIVALIRYIRSRKTTP